MTPERLLIGSITPDPTVLGGQLLATRGEATITLVSRRSGRHVTLHLRCSRRQRSTPRWPTVPYAHAERVWIDDERGRHVATFMPLDGLLVFDASSTQAARWTTVALLKHLAGRYPELLTMAEVALSSGVARAERAVA